MQKTAYEVRISDWSSDVCSSDLVAPVDDDLARDELAGMLGRQLAAVLIPFRHDDDGVGAAEGFVAVFDVVQLRVDAAGVLDRGGVGGREYRKSVVLGKSLSIRVGLGGGRLMKKKQKKIKT